MEAERADILACRPADTTNAYIKFDRHECRTRQSEMTISYWVGGAPLKRRNSQSQLVRDAYWRCSCLLSETANGRVGRKQQ